MFSRTISWLQKFRSLSQLKLNVIANYAGQFWSRLISFLLVPVYLHYLGVEAYGLMGAFAAITSFVWLLDLGLSPTVNREVTRRWAIPEKRATIPNLLRTAEVIYWGVGVGLILLMALLSQPIATQWLNSDNLDPGTVKFAVLILGFTFAIRWPVTPYTGTLMALEKQVQLNILQGTLKTVQSLGAVVILVWISSTIVAFLLWQTLLTVVEVLLLMVLTWRYVPKGLYRPHFKLEILQQVWQFAAGISGTMIVTLLLTQVDKILLSKLLTLEQFGYYMLASTLAGQLSVIFAPFLNALFPRLTALVAQEDEKELARIFHQGSLFVSILVAPAAATLVIFGPVILYLWTQSPEIVEHAAKPLSLLVFGTLMNSMIHIPYQLQLAIGKPQIAAIVNTCAVIVLVPAMFLVLPQWGMVGAALIWAILNTSYYIGTSRITHWYILPNEYGQWLLQDTLVPIMLSFAIVFVAWQVQLMYEGRFVTIIGLGAGLCLSYGLAFSWYIYKKKCYREKPKSSLQN